MIDTIILRIHDLRKYRDLIKGLNLKRHPGFKFKTATIDTERSEKLDKIGYKMDKQKFDIMELTGKAEYLVKTQVAKQVSQSYHYAFIYRIDYTSDFIEFNFSIPKYKYGTNVLMFVEHQHDEFYSNYNCSTLEHNIARAPEFLQLFIEEFLKKEFILTKIDLRDVEVNRIDVCYNQIFKTKEDALVYFNYQKRLKKKHSRDEDGGKTDYNTSFMYATKRSSAKVYHKGTEYRKHDRKEHLKYNQRKGIKYFRTDVIEELADRILRYELTIRSAELNYLFKHNLFRKECPFYKIDYRNYMRISNTKKRNDRIAMKIGQLPKDEREEFSLLHPYERISANDNKTWRHVSNLIERKSYFMMSIDEEAEVYNQKTVSYECRRALFSNELISLCLKKLVAFINEFRIKELPNEEKIGLLIDNYNSTHKVKMQKSDMMVFYMELVRHGSFKEAAKFIGYSRATQFRYQQRFKKLGITANNVQPNTSLSIPNPPMDLKQYHSYLFYNNPMYPNIFHRIKIKNR